MGYLDSNGLSYFWGKIKSYIAGLGYYTKPSGGIPASDIASGVIPSVPTALSSFTDDLGSSPTHTHSQYLTSAPVTSVNGQTGAVSLSIPTESTVSGWGFTKNAGTVTSVTVNGSTYSPTNGDVDLGTIGGGTVYTAAWTASSSSSSTIRLTDILSLTEGLYIARIQLPVTQNSMTVQLDGTNIVQRNNTYYNGPNYSVFMDFIEVSSGGGTLYVRSASNAAHSFSYLERGSLKALKLM